MKVLLLVFLLTGCGGPCLRERQIVETHAQIVERCGKMNGCVITGAELEMMIYAEQDLRICELRRASR